MPVPTTDRTSASRLVGLAVTAGVAIVVLVVLPLPALPHRPSDIERWWGSTGTASATMSVLRATGIAIAGWMLAVTAFGTMAALSGWRPALKVWQSAAPAGIRRLAIASAFVAATSVPDTSLAAQDDRPPILRDLGSADAPTEPMPPLLHDLGPVDHERVRRPLAPHAELDAQPAGDDVWVVERGDHLWGVAETTLAERGEKTTDAAVARYWRDVIALNRTAIGSDPDLIHPGLVLRLP
jgi:hypothetical protein